MDIVAHGLWAAAAAITAKRTAHIRLRIGWAVWWAAFPDVLAFGPTAVVGLCLYIAGGKHGRLPYVHLGLPLYPAGHSLLTCLLAFALASLVARRPLWSMLGWLTHILIDIFTHSDAYYATRFLWPVSDVHVDGIPWWTPWFWIGTYAALLLVYGSMWKSGLLRRRSPGQAS
jgi:hypothetical protein